MSITDNDLDFPQTIITGLKILYCKNNPDIEWQSCNVAERHEFPAGQPKNEDEWEIFFHW
jgi:hypothetical protein